ncbi:MAG: hypothetical protein OXC57_12400 [Rhodobacteraceae bacterium]|nr:hypothetical protein [Paracoccaceae bacterium]
MTDDVVYHRIDIYQYFNAPQGTLGVFVIVILQQCVCRNRLEDLHLDFMERTEEEIKRINSVASPTSDFSKPEQFETNSAGAATVRAQMDRDAFSQPSKNVSFEAELDFLVGNGLFRKVWVSSPVSTLASDGLGPLFNARPCQRCHI